MLRTLPATRILIVEDNAFLALEMEDLLTEAGAEIVGPVGTLSEGLELARDTGFDLAILNVNLGDDLSYPIADQLKRRGIPYVFASASAAYLLPPQHGDAPKLAKPYRSADLLGAVFQITDATARRRGLAVSPGTA